jgi:hypothetical protein
MANEGADFSSARNVICLRDRGAHAVCPVPGFPRPFYSNTACSGE